MYEQGCCDLCSHILNKFRDLMHGYLIICFFEKGYIQPLHQSHGYLIKEKV